MKFRQVPDISKFTKTLSLKVTRVVNLNLVFTDYFFLKLAVLIKLCKIRYLN